MAPRRFPIKRPPRLVTGRRQDGRIQRLRLVFVQSAPRTNSFLSRRHILLDIPCGRSPNMRQLQRSMLAGLILPALLAFTSRPAHAHDLKCSAPPYGDAAWNYARLKQRFASIDEDKID